MDVWNWLVFYKVQFTHSVRICWTGKLNLPLSSQSFLASKMIIFFSYMLFIFSYFISYDLPLFNFTFFCGIIFSGITRNDRSKYDVTSYTMKYYISISVVAGMPSVQDLWSKRYLTIQSGHVAHSFTEETKKNRKMKESHSDGKHMRTGFPICLFFIDEPSATYYICSWKRDSKLFLHSFFQKTPTQQWKDKFRMCPP
jgi:hypothetical protein